MKEILEKLSEQIRLDIFEAETASDLVRVGGLATALNHIKDVLKELPEEPERRHGIPGFYELLNTMADIHSAKNHDYAGEDPLSNFTTCEKLGILAWKGCLVRMTDKYCRLANFAKSNEMHVSDENFEDTLVDLANYSIICVLLYRRNNLF